MVDAASSTLNEPLMLDTHSHLRQRLDAETRLDLETGCLVWQGATTKKGYGRFRAGGPKLLAHRVAWEVFKGPIPEGLCVLHKCDNPPCCAVDHLFLGTKTINRLDCVTKGRQSRGETHGTVKLTESQVLEVRVLYATGLYTQQQLADARGVSQTLISAVVRREIWGHVK